jgi:hypothetical protein
MKPCLALTGLLATILTAVVTAQETSFLEKFALAADRDAVLKELIPGTDDYYYYHALHLQNQGKKAELQALLVEWKSRFEDTNNRREEIKNRQALLDYATDPAGSLAYLRNKLAITYNHQRITPDARPDLATKLDAALISWEAFLEQRHGFVRQPDNDWTGKCDAQRACGTDSGAAQGSAEPHPPSGLQGAGADDQ